VAREKTTKSAAKKPAANSQRKPASARPSGAAKVQKIAKAAKVEKVMKGAKKIASSPATTEIVAATLVAAAAALRDPKKARALAAEAAHDLKQAAKTGVDGGALWQLALDVARRSIDAIGEEKGGKPKAKAKKANGKAKDKAKKAGKKK
jgi:hypothetical protein